MAFYKTLRDERTYPRGRDRPGQAGWIAERLLRLRALLNGRITSVRQPNSLIIGSWNIRHFDGGRLRLNESMHYIAEIIDHFDICAIQEVKDIASMDRVMRLLGPNWTYFINDSSGAGRGNYERMAFAYNRNRVFFRNLIGEMVFPKGTLPSDEQIGRTPFFAAFQAGWFRFTLCSTHIVFEEKKNRPLRQDEIRVIAAELTRRAKDTDEVHIMLGDMNIETLADPGGKALLENGFTVSPLPPSSLDGKKAYDQIAFTGPADVNNLLRADIIPWHEAVYPLTEAASYVAMSTDPAAATQPEGVYPRTEKAFSSWRTHEISDHLPVWIEIRTDFSNTYLQETVDLKPGK
jgi:endonuclease/exonuclease/phosphatase family metal-dependent hydrolase